LDFRSPSDLYAPRRRHQPSLLHVDVSGFKSVSSPTITIVLTANRFSFTRGFYVNTFLTNGLGNLRSISDNTPHWPVSITFVGLYCYLRSWVIPYLCMGSFNRFRSAHQADIKGKGILYEDDDEPIKLVDRDDSFVIKEFGLSLIGKVLNPKKQNVEKLLQTMPSQWGLSERITANDLGNGKFLLNFMSEEDLNSVLRRGPFHYNFCMFVLVRWEPIVHDDYPWIIPFWVQLIGFPLHLWTDMNLRNIGGRLGHVDTLELTEGRMLIEVDSRRPLKFSRKVEYEGDEVTIEIKYDKLFKHCTICGLLSHEKGYCPSMDVRSRLQHVDRPDFFSRVQRAQDMPRQNWSRDALVNARPSQQSSLQTRELQSSRYYTSKPVRYDDKSTRGQGPRYWENDSSRGRHSDRIIRSRDDHLRRNRYGSARDNPGPYARPNEKAWKVKPKTHEVGRGQSAVDEDAMIRGATSGEIVPYEQSPEHKSRSIVDLAEMRSGEKTSNRKLASTIVTPVRADHPMEENVTLRDRGEARALAFSPNGEPSHADDLIIGALSDMEIMEQSDGALMADGDDGEDLLGLDLMELEDRQPQLRSLQVLGRRSSSRSSRTKKLGAKRSAPLGINRKFEILRRGSPSKRSTATVSHVAEGGEKPRSHNGSSKDKEKASKHDGLMSSKYSS